MRHRIFALALALSTLSAALSPAASAQQRPNPMGDWSAVQALSQGEKIVVRLKEGDRLVGRFESATDLLLNFRHDGRTVSLTRESIRRVQLNRGKSRLGGALLGAGIGAGGGAAFGGYLYSLGDFNGSTVPGFGLVGAGIGAGIGAAIGKGNKNETIYEAP
ncbi:MAG TPA: hypothetical protein VGX48_09445 [Pyrinomonadaceae bacterium]|jgi:hypothetical protein|nr:hypothetical protein [Pyrinomonadaceae bacterium]